MSEVAVSKGSGTRERIVRTAGVLAEEESGYEVRAVRLLALWDRDKHPHPPMPFHVYKLFVLCEFLGGEALSEGAETSEIGFFDARAAPELSSGRVLPEQVRKLTKLARERQGAADLD